MSTMRYVQVISITKCYLSNNIVLYVNKHYMYIEEWEEVAKWEIPKRLMMYIWHLNAPHHLQISCFKRRFSYVNRRREIWKWNNWNIVHFTVIIVIAVMSQLHNVIEIQTFERMNAKWVMTDTWLQWAAAQCNKFFIRVNDQAEI